MANIELTVPDIGDFHDIPVIEVLVNPGERVDKDAPLVTLESDKATMEVPATASGVVKELKVKVGDRVSKGSVLALLDAADKQSPTPVTPPEISPNDATGIVAEIAGTEQEDAAVSTATGTPRDVIDLVVPDIGDFHDIPVIEVLVAPGQTVKKDEPLVTLESEKATMEVPAAASGTVEAVRVKVGDRVSQGTVIATVATQGTNTGPNGARRDAGVAPAPARAPESPVTLGPSTSSGPKGDAAPIAPSTTPTNGKLPSATTGPVHASPAIRRFGRELGVDLARVHGSGPNGRITREDVQGFVKTALRTPAAQPGVHAGTTSGLGLGLPPWPSVDFARFGPVERVPLPRIKRISGPALARNWVMIPHVFQSDEANVTDLEAFRKEINAEHKDVKVTMLAFLIKACVAMLKRYPELNASLDGEELVYKRYYNIGYAADTPGGLLVPVIRDADRKGILEIARETSELAGKAREGKLSADDMSGATFTISSLGSIGGTDFTPIINAPEVAILGAAKASIKPVWDGSAFAPRLIQPLTLSYDHRVIDGALGARAVVAIREALSDLRRTLL